MTADIILTFALVCIAIGIPIGWYLRGAADEGRALENEEAEILFRSLADEGRTEELKEAKNIYRKLGVAEAKARIAYRDAVRATREKSLNDASRKH